MSVLDNPETLTQTFPQGTPEWFTQRLGNVTGSRLPDVQAKPGTASRENYKVDLLLERLTGAPKVSYVSPAMAQGTEREPRARAAFEFMTGLKVREVGYVPHPTIKRFGASPDGLVDDDDTLEIKCPQPATHWSYLLNPGKVPRKYWPQTQGQLMCTQRRRVHFVSFCPDFPEPLMFFHAVMEVAPKFVADLEKDIKQFLVELDEDEAHALEMMRKEHDRTDV